MIAAAPSPARVALAAVAGTAIAQGCGRFALTPLLPDMQAAAALDHAAAGWLASANFAGYLAGSLLLAARAGALPVAPVPLGLAAVVIGALGMAPAAALWPWVAARFVAGFGGALLFLGALDAAARLAPSIGPRPFAGVGLGIAATGIAALALLPDWRFGWLAMAALAAAGWPLLAQLRAAARATTVPEPAPAPTAAFLRLALAYLLFAAAFGAAATFFVALFADGDPRHATVAWIVAGLCAAPSVPLWTRVAQRLGDARAFAAALALEAAGIALAALDSRPAFAALSGALLGGTFMGLTALGLMRARRLAATAPRRASALMTALFGLGQIAGAPAAGWIAARHDGLAAGLWTAALAATIGVVLLLPDLGRRARA